MLGSVNHRHSLSSCSAAGEFKTKMSTWLVPSQGMAVIPLHTALSALVVPGIESWGSVLCS